MFQTKIFTDEKAKVTVCRVYEVTDKWTDSDGKKHLLTRPLTSAKVTCKEDDEFDKEKGRQMAYARAMVKACEKLIKRTTRYKKQLEENIKKYNSDIEHNIDVMNYYKEEYENLAK